MTAVGRDPDHRKILPAAFVAVGDTIEDARAQRAELDSLVQYDSGIGSRNGMLPWDVSCLDPDGHSPEMGAPGRLLLVVAGRSTTES